MSAVTRMIARRGRTWLWCLWSESGSNEYNRTEKVLGAPIDIVAIRTETAKERTTMDVRGQERTLDAQLLVDLSVDVSDVEDTTKIAPIAVSPSGVSYDAIALGREGEVMDFHRIFLSKRRSNVSPVLATGAFSSGFSNGFDI